MILAKLFLILLLEKTLEVPCNQVWAKIDELAKNSTWGGTRRSTLKGMLDISNFHTITVKIEAIIDKKLSNLNLGTNTGRSN